MNDKEWVEQNDKEWVEQEIEKIGNDSRRLVELYGRLQYEGSTNAAEFLEAEIIRRLEDAKDAALERRDSFERRAD